MLNMQLQRPSWGPQNLGWGVLGSGSGPQANTATSGPMFLHGWAPPASGACEWDPRKGLAGVSTPRVPGPSSTVQAPRMITVQCVCGSCCPHWLLVYLWGCVSEHVPHACVSTSLRHVSMPCRFVCKVMGLGIRLQWSQAGECVLRGPSLCVFYVFVIIICIKLPFYFFVYSSILR